MFSLVDSTGAVASLVSGAVHRIQPLYVVGSLPLDAQWPRLEASYDMLAANVQTLARALRMQSPTLAERRNLMSCLVTLSRGRSSR